MAVTQELEPSLLLPKVCIIRKLDSKAQLEFSYPKHHFNCNTKHLFLYRPLSKRYQWQENRGEFRLDDLKRQEATWQQVWQTTDSFGQFPNNKQGIRDFSLLTSSDHTNRSILRRIFFLSDFVYKCILPDTLISVLWDIIMWKSNNAMLNF